MRGLGHRPTVPPQLLHGGFILLCHRTPTEYLHFERPLTPFSASQPAQDLSPSRGMTESSPHSRASTLASFRPQAFTASRRFAPRPSVTGLFHPATTSRILPFREFSLRVAVLSLERRCPRVVVYKPASRPKTVPPASLLDFEALLHTKTRSSGLGISRPIRRFPRRFRPPPGHLSLPCPSVTQRDPLMSLSTSDVLSPEGNRPSWSTPFSVFPASPLVSSLLSRPTCSRFRAFFPANQRSTGELGSPA